MVLLLQRRLVAGISIVNTLRRVELGHVYPINISIL